MGKGIAKVAIKSPAGKVSTAPIGKHHHDIAAHGKHGFTTTAGAFVGRAEGAKIATRSGQTKEATKSLHSHQLRSKSK